MSLVIYREEEFENRRGDRRLPDASAGLRAQVAQLRAENARLRRELARLGEYQQLAFRDALTGLRNRRSFEERLNEECGRAQRSDGYGFSVLLLDVDEFKAVNDTFGHATGDKVLAGVAELIDDSVRSVDLCYRIGGDEFAIILPDTDVAGATSVIERLRVAIDPALHALPVPVGLSIGAASSPPDGPDAAAVVAAADADMYRDKLARKSTDDQ